MRCVFDVFSSHVSINPRIVNRQFAWFCTYTPKVDARVDAHCLCRLDRRSGERSRGGRPCADFSASQLRRLPHGGHARHRQRLSRSARPAGQGACSLHRADLLAPRFRPSQRPCGANVFDGRAVGLRLAPIRARPIALFCLPGPCIRLDSSWRWRRHLSSTSRSPFLLLVTALAG